MKIVIFASLVALSAAACTPKEPVVEPVTMAPKAEATAADMVASAKCNHYIAERDEWLKAERPPVSVVESSYNSRGIDPNESAVFVAYSAYMESGGDHDAAAAIFDTKMPSGNYPNAASCFL